jgi:hypothetical protein
MKSIRYSILLVGLFAVQFTQAQITRTEVVVVGGTESGLAAAIQSAHSGVKTVYIVEGNELASNISVNADTVFSAGIFKQLLKLTLKARTDSTSGIVNQFTRTSLLDAFKGWTDTIKNLSVMRNSSVQKIEKSGKGWDFKLKDGKTVKASVTVDATLNGDIAAKANVPRDQKTSYFKTLVPFEQDIENLYDNRLYRTTVGILNIADHVFTIPLGSLAASAQENMILAGRVPIPAYSKQAATMSIGQAAGASAAFCSFFKTTTNSLGARAIQAELFLYKDWLMPFSDIQYADSNFAAIQRIGITGLLKGKAVRGKLLFQPDSLISAEEVRQPMREYYSRSQLWFADNKVAKFTLADVLSLIKFNASRGEELNAEVEKGWKKSFKFSGEFDLMHFVTRREFAVLADAYLKPFNVRVDISGNLGS